MLACSQRRRRTADRRRRQRGAGHRRGRPPGRAVQRRPGRALSRGGLTRDGRRRPARRPSPTSCCSSAAPTAATPRCCWRDAASLAAAAGPGRSWSPATSTRGDEVARDPRGAGTPVRPGRQRRARGSACSPRSRPAPRSARCSCAHVIGGKHLLARRRLHRDGPRRDPRRRAHRRRAARARAGRASTPAPATWWSSTSAAPRPTCTRVVEIDPEDAGLAREVVATAPVTRTVEGDLGMRWSAVTTVEAAAPDAPRRRAARRSRRRRDAAAVPRRTTPSARTTRPSPPRPRSAGAAPARRPQQVVLQPRRAGSSSAAARTCARSTCWSARAACCATDAPGVAARVLAAAPATTSTGGWQLPRAPRVGRRPRLRARRGRPAGRALPRGGTRPARRPAGRCRRGEPVSSLSNVSDDVTLDDIGAAREAIADVAVDGPRWRSRAGSPRWSAGRLAQVREPPAHRLVQDPRRLRADLPAVRGGAGARRRRGLAPATTPRASRWPRSCSASSPPCSCPRARRSRRSGHPGVRRRRGLRGQLARGLARPRPGEFAERDRGGADPPLRPRRHRGGAGHPRPRDPRAGARRRRPCWCPPAAAACWPASRSRSRRCGPTCGSSGVQAEGAAAYPGSLGAGPPRAAGVDEHDGRRHRGRPARRHHRSPRSATTSTRSSRSPRSRSRGRCSPLLERAKMVVEPAGAAAVAALLDQPARRSRRPAVAVLSGGNIDPLLLGKVIRHGMAAAGRYLNLRVCIPDLPGGLARLLTEVGGGRRQRARGRPRAASRRRCTSTRSRCSSSWRPAASRHAEQVLARLRERGYRVYRVTRSRERVRPV